MPPKKIKKKNPKQQGLSVFLKNTSTQNNPETENTNNGEGSSQLSCNYTLGCAMMRPKISWSPLLHCIPSLRLLAFIVPEKSLTKNLTYLAHVYLELYNIKKKGHFSL